MDIILYSNAWLIPFLPFMSALITSFGLLSFRRPTKLIRSFFGFLSITLIAFSFILSVGIGWQQWQGVPNGDSYQFLFRWVLNKDFGLDLGFLVDPMSSLMLLIVTSVAFLVMLYSNSYMAHDQGYVRFFAYLSIFTTSMLGLVLSPNLIQLYIFWELVGMCSYLLVGFWYTRPTAADAAQKAFVTNRVGDFGFLLGILGFYWLTGSFDFEGIGATLKTLISERSSDAIISGVGEVGALASHGVTSIVGHGVTPVMSLGFVFSFLILMGPLAKSAQFPLHVWLPDAMEGPTPISALIHAATMVAAGIFLVARMFPIFSQFPLLMELIAWIGAITAILGATVALTQNDLKKGLAYSTVSQLGYMMMALGVGSPTASLFHLLTHAFSKALLFLGSGSVILGMEEFVGLNPAMNQNMGLMGGLRKYMPITSITFLIGTLSLCGFPPFSCFWSKDLILENLFHHNVLLWLLAWLTAGLTSFYMFRLYFLTFEGESRFPNKQSGSLESSFEKNVIPFNITFCLLVLTIPTISIGWLGTPFNNYFELFLTGSTNADPIGKEFLLTAGSSVGISLIGLTISSLLYRENKVVSFSFLKPLYSFFLNKWYLDEFYTNFLVYPSRQISSFILKIDQLFIDAFVNLSASITLSLGQLFRFSQTGKVQNSFLLISFFVILSTFFGFLVNPT